MSEQQKDILVVGSGVAGLSAAQGLARRGFGVLLVEQEGTLGGKAARYTCKAVAGRCRNCGACLVQEALDQIRGLPEIDIRTRTRISEIVRRDSGFQATLAGPDGGQMVSCDAVVLAHGFDPFDPAQKPNLCFAHLPNMITAMTLEEMLRESDGPLRPSDGKAPESIAFVQCVGSRDPKRGHAYCSQVCCPYALRMARRIQDRAPGTRITVFYMDIQTFGRDFAEQWPALQTEFQFIREIPGDYFSGDGDRVGVSVELADEIQDLYFDLMVLSVGMTPVAVPPALEQELGLLPSAEGFLLPKGCDGVYVVGSATGPMDIPGSITHALAAVPAIAAELEGGK